MTILDAVPPEGSEITVVQLRLAPLSFTHWNSSRFLESFNYVMHCWRWNIQISSYLSLRNIVFKHFNNCLTYLLANWRSSAHLAPKGLDLSWMLLLYQIIITITCWHHLFFKSQSLFNQFYLITSPKLLLSQLFLECVAGLNDRKGCNIYKWHEVDQTKHEIFCVHIVCNEIQVKVNLEITTFFFYLCFPYCPNFSDLGLYVYMYIRLIIFYAWSIYYAFTL